MNDYMYEYEGRGDGGDEERCEEEDGVSAGQEESCQGMIEKIKDGRGENV